MKKNLEGIYNLAAAAMVSSTLLAPGAVFAQANDGAPLTDTSENSILMEDVSFLERIGSPIDFGSPWMLATLPPALLAGYMLMRSIERQPKKVFFPALFLFNGIENKERTADRMPIWQQLLGYGAITAAGVGASIAMWDPKDSFAEDGAIILAIDNGADSAMDWEAYQNRARNILRQASIQDREILIFEMASLNDPDGMRVLPLMSPEDALVQIEKMYPMPWSVDHALASLKIEALPQAEYGASFWLGSGLTQTPEDSMAFAEALNSKAPLTPYKMDEDTYPVVIRDAIFTAGDYQLFLNRPFYDDAEDIRISAYRRDGSVLASQNYTFEKGQGEADFIFDMPDVISTATVDNTLFRFSISNKVNAAGSYIIDDQWKPRSVGIVISGESDLNSLLGEARYIEKALKDKTRIFTSTRAEELIDSGDISILVVPDTITLSSAATLKIKDWVENTGGTFIRTAGANMARQDHNNDPLLPVDLRKGLRNIQAENQDGINGRSIMQFGASSPLKGILPDANARVERQVLVKPGPDIEAKTWAKLDDGTPLISADKRGAGQVILFHTTFNTIGGNFALSENFIAVLNGLVASANSVEQNELSESQNLNPLLVLDGFGQAVQPENSMQAQIGTSCVIGPKTPPGLYGSELSALACNLGPSLGEIQSVNLESLDIKQEFYTVANSGVNLKGYAWGAFIAFVFAGSMAVIAQQNGFGRRGKESALHDKETGKPHVAFLDDQSPEI